MTKQPETTSVIGFGGTYYTLWSVREEVKHYTSPNGQSYPSSKVYHYAYIHNISKDLEKVKELYPNTPIDMELKGERSFVRTDSQEDLSPEILKFGKYRGRDIRDIAKEDLEYLIYLLAISEKADLERILKTTPEYQKYLIEKEKEIKTKISKFRPLESGKVVLTLERNPDYDGVARVQIMEGQAIELHFSEVREGYYNGHTYYLPVFENGKAKRVKGKEVEYDLEIIETEINKEAGYCFQVANVLN